jgi:hypothetical protein
MGKSSIFEIDSAEVVESFPPDKRFLFLTVLLAIKDRATAIHFDPSVADGEWKLSYKVNGALRNLTPVPLFVPVSREARKLAGIGRIRGLLLTSRCILALTGPQTTSKAGHFLLSIAGKVVDLDVFVQPSKAGCIRSLQSVVIQLPDGPLPSEDARDILKRIMERRSSRRTSLSGGHSTDPVSVQPSP